VPDAIRIAGVAKAGGEALDEPDGFVRLGQEQRAPSEDTIPPSKAATTRRPPALPNPIAFALHCVCIGEPLESA
jgi:hypothetical protein